MKKIKGEHPVGGRDTGLNAKAFPTELRRILQLPDMVKVGVGLTKDISIIWDDLRSEMKNLVDVGMKAKLVLAEKYPKMSYGNLALKTGVEDVLGFTIYKDLGESHWSANVLSDEQKQCKSDSRYHRHTQAHT